MSYTVLARKYRSSNFDELVGQEQVAQTIKRAIESGRIAHAFLFCGTRGTGKTSTARILAKALNCQQSDKPTALPCGECESCKRIARGDDMDVIEIDAASNTGVDNVRELIGNAQYRPVNSRFKIYIIDEVHMLSKSAFNALLKTLEEPPEHVKFILATTEAEKVLPTIQSRCQRYDFRNIPTREIAAHLASICKNEKIRADEDALLLVAKAGAGSMRDSLSLLDRLLSVGEKHLTSEMIEQLLGLPKAQIIFEIVNAISAGDTKQTLSLTSNVITRGLATETLVGSLIDHLHNLLIIRTCGLESGLVEMPGIVPKDLREQAERFDPITLSQDIALLEELKRTLRTAQAGRALVDATLVRLALAEQFTSIADLLSGNGAPPTEVPALKKKYDLTPSPKILGEVQKANVLAGQPAQAHIADSPLSHASSTELTETETVSDLKESPLPEYREREQISVVSTAVEDKDDLPAVGKVWEGEKVSLSAAFKKYNQKPHPPVNRHPEPVNLEPVDSSDLHAVMHRLQGAVTQHNGISAFLSQGQLKSIGDNLAVIAFPTSSLAPTMLERGNKKQTLTEALSQVIGRNVSVKFELDESLQTAPPAAAQPVRPAPTRTESNRPAAPQPVAQPTIRLTPELREKLAQDALVQAVMTELGGDIVKVE